MCRATLQRFQRGYWILGPGTGELTIWESPVCTESPQTHETAQDYKHGTRSHWGRAAVSRGQTWEPNRALLQGGGAVSGCSLPDTVRITENLARAWE